MNKNWSDEAWDDYMSWQSDKRIVKKINKLIKDIAKEIVVTNPNKLVDEISEITPVKDKLYTPKMCIW